jgi:hypothetical protein
VVFYDDNNILSSANGFQMPTGTIDRLSMLEALNVLDYDPSYEFETKPSQISQIEFDEFQRRQSINCGCRDVEAVCGREDNVLVLIKSGDN